MSTPGPVPGPRIVEADEVIAGWPEWAREGFALWMAGTAPEYVDAYDQVVRRLESGIAARALARSTQD
jgi:hypothetical protein